jgi:uncharacterized protein
MVYHDEIYGDYQITDPILQDLLNSRAMQRLRGIMQHGITGLIGITSPVTRFEHSVGTMILVDILGGTLAEKIAALLHDVSHTAFSHVIDYVYNNHQGQSFHDEEKESFWAESDIPGVLIQYGLSWPDFLNETRYSLLEQPAPRLCADRLDYFFRDSRDLGLATDLDLQEAVQDLAVFNGRIVSKSLQTAKWLAYSYIAADDASWSNFREVGLYEITAMAIRRGFEIGLLYKEDIWGTDDPLWRKMQESNDEKLQSYLRLISPDTKFVWDDTKPTFRVSTKLRTIDPEIIVNGELVTVSSLDPQFKEHRRSYLAKKQGSWPMRVIAPS